MVHGISRHIPGRGIPVNTSPCHIHTVPDGTCLWTVQNRIVPWTVLGVVMAGMVPGRLVPGISSTEYHVGYYSTTYGTHPAAALVPGISSQIKSRGATWNHPDGQCLWTRTQTCSLDCFWSASGGICIGKARDREHWSTECPANSKQGVAKHGYPHPGDHQNIWQ